MARSKGVGIPLDGGLNVTVYTAHLKVQVSVFAATHKAVLALCKTKISQQGTLRGAMYMIFWPG